MSRSADTRPNERQRAHRANELAPDLIVGFALPRTDAPGVCYFASALSHSEVGQAIASFVASRIGLEPLGRVMPILVETRAPAVRITVPTPDGALGATVVEMLDGWLRTGPQVGESPL